MPRGPALDAVRPLLGGRALPTTARGQRTTCPGELTAALQGGLAQVDEVADGDSVD